MNSKTGLCTNLIHFYYCIDNDKNLVYNLHCHNFYEIYYFISGNVRYLVEGKLYIPAPHSILILPSNTFHSVKAENNNIYERYTLHFSPNIISPRNRTLLLSSFSQSNSQTDIYYENVNAFKMRNFFESLLDCRKMSNDIKEISISIRIEALLSQLLFMSSSSKSFSSEKSCPNNISDIIYYLNEHLTENITLDELSNIFFISKHHLNKIFRKVTGTTIFDYVIHKRVTLAQQLITQGQSASSASTNAGFHDYSSFFRAYKKIFGYSPAHKNSFIRTS